MKRAESKSNQILKAFINFICTLCISCCVLGINTSSAFADTVKVKDVSADEYTLTLEERAGVKEQIKGTEIKLKYNSDNSQKVTFDENLLKGSINKLSCFNISKIIEPQNARVAYVNNSYVISKEVNGNKIKKDVLYDAIVKAIQNKDTSINLEAKNCHENPKFLSNSPEIINARDTANRYLSSNITYNFAGLTWNLNGSTIKDWVSVNGNFQVTLDESKVRAYVDNLANTYTTEQGYNIPVSGGYDGNNHSWIVDSAQEAAALISNIKSGQTISKSPIYYQTSSASYFSDLGSTYIEVDMTKQHLWFYKYGYLVVDGDVVTGNLSESGCETITGAFKIYSMQRDAVLTGPGYASPVDFWMPFSGNYGLHNAPWRSEFGGDIYKTNGSHGCVNLSYSLAQTIYQNAYIGIPVITYYS